MMQSIAIPIKKGTANDGSVVSSCPQQSITAQLKVKVK